MNTETIISLMRVIALIFVLQMRKYIKYIKINYKLGNINNVSPVKLVYCGSANSSN